MQLPHGDSCRVVIGDAAPQEFAIGCIRRIGEEGDAIRDVLVYQVGGLEHSGTVRIDRENYDIRLLQLVRCNQKPTHGTQQ